ALPETMAVSAMDPIDDSFWPGTNLSNFPHTNSLVSSPGAAIDVAAPGVNILSTFIGTNYAVFSGTSMACGHVSGLVALYIAANGRAHSAQEVYKIRQRIIDAAQPQSQWLTPDVDPDLNQEGLAVASESWIPQPRIVSQG